METNPRTPNEAIKILGVFLRARRRFSGQIPYLPNESINSGGFYWALVCERMPHLWPFHLACGATELRRLADGVFTRCKRVLMALDEMAEQFYLLQNRDTAERSLYHFDYLMLQLAGAFDALARIAHSVYDITKPKPHDASFRTYEDGRMPFLDALAAQNATALHAIASRAACKDLLTIVHLLRNTVHGISLNEMPVMSSTEQDYVYARLPPEEGQKVFETISRRAPVEEWGLSRRFGFDLEPYPFASRVVAEALPIVDAIIQAIDIERMLPAGSTARGVVQPFDEHMRRWVSVLG